MLPPITYDWVYELIHTHTQGGVPILVCAYETETGQVFDACQTDRNSGLTSCVGLGCWTETKVFTWAVP